MPMWMNTTFQEMTSLNMKNCVLFYDICMTVLTGIFMFFLTTMMLILINNFMNLKFMKNHLLEILWSIAPIIILVFIAIPSVNTLYTNSQDSTKMMTSMKIIGSQWKWDYQSEFLLEKSPFLVSDSSNLKSNFTDNLMKVMPVTVNSSLLKIQVTSEDVIHSWFLPGAGIKIDAVPGKMSEQNIMFKRQGYMFGNCTEVCGPFHSMMPIKVLVNNN